MEAWLAICDGLEEMFPRCRVLRNNYYSMTMYRVGTSVEDYVVVRMEKGRLRCTHRVFGGELLGVYDTELADPVGFEGMVDFIGSGLVPSWRQMKRLKAERAVGHVSVVNS